MDIKKNFLLSLIIISSIVNCFSASNATVRKKILFNDDWRFILGDNSQYRDSTFDDSLWRKLQLPHDWSVEGEYDETVGGSGGFFPIGVGWYRKTFELPQSMQKKKVIIRFDGVYMNSEVWINGIFLGRYPYGYTTFEYDITDYVKREKDAQNVIAVRVDNSLKESARWYNGSGIYRNVWLMATDYIHFDTYKGVFISTLDASASQATVAVDYEFASHFFSLDEKLAWEKDIWNPNPPKTTAALTLRTTVTDADGREIVVAETQKECSSFESIHQLRETLTIPAPSLWSANTPSLYYLKSEILYNGKVYDDVTTTFGIRKLEYIPHQGMFVNGQQIKLNGVCLHQDIGSFGTAVPVAVWKHRLLLLKDMGCNAVRTAHHPFAPEFYDLCDSLGLYIMDEAFDEWTRGWTYNYTANVRGKAQNGYQHYFKQWSETDLKAMIHRDRNHPSVIMYSIGNEIPDQINSDSWITAKKLVEIVHETDSTRPVTAGCDQYMKAHKNGFMDELDILGYNYVKRHYDDKMYSEQHAMKPDKLCIGTETNKSTLDFTAYRDNDYVIGAFIWVGIDYWGETKKAPQRGWTGGLIDVAGIKKPEYYLYKSYWDSEPSLALAVKPVGPQRNNLVPAWTGVAQDSLQLYAFTNCDEVELFLNNKSLGRRAVGKNSYIAEWNLTYTPGTIKAIAYNNKKKVLEKVLKTAAAPAEIVVTCDKKELNAQGQEIAFAEISVVDRFGTVVTTFADNLSVQVTGVGELLAVDTGDMFYKGNMKVSTRQPHQGKMMVAVKGTGAAGDILLQISSDTLPPTVVRLKSK